MILSLLILSNLLECLVHENEGSNIPPLRFVLLVYAKYEMEQMATINTTPRAIRFAHYHIRALPFVDVEVEEHNDHVGSSEDDYNMDLGT